MKSETKLSIMFFIIWIAILVGLMSTAQDDRVPYPHEYKIGDPLYLVTFDERRTKLCERVVVTGVADYGPGVTVRLNDGSVILISELYLYPDCGN